MYSSELKLGGMCHISNCRQTDTTPSKRLLRNEGYYYADTAVEELLRRFRIFNKRKKIDTRKIRIILTGGYNNSMPMLESLQVLGIKQLPDGKLRTEYSSKYHFKLRGYDVGQLVHRSVVFDISKAQVTIKKDAPYAALTGTNAGKDIDVLLFSLM
jgi:chemotaxis receptor (MCP) glutamine deamidase CheD